MVRGSAQTPCVVGIMHETIAASHDTGTCFMPFTEPAHLPPPPPPTHTLLHTHTHTARLDRHQLRQRIRSPPRLDCHLDWAPLAAKTLSILQ